MRSDFGKTSKQGKEKVSVLLVPEVYGRSRVVAVAAAAESPAKADAPLAPPLVAPMAAAAPSLSSLTVLQPVHSTTIPGYASFAQYAAPAPLKPQPLLTLEDANHNTTASTTGPQEQCPDGERTERDLQ